MSIRSDFFNLIIPSCDLFEGFVETTLRFSMGTFTILDSFGSFVQSCLGLNEFFALTFDIRIESFEFLFNGRFLRLQSG
jgi:hypothetical protein